MKGMMTVFGKEVRENSRDKRAMFNTLVLGPVLMPVLFIGLMWFLVSKEEERAEETLKIPVVGAEYAPNLVQFLEQQGAELLPAPDDPEGAVRLQKHPLVLRIPEEFPEQWKAGEPAVVEVIADPTRRETETALRRTRGLVSAWGQTIGALRLQLRGVPPTLSAPVMVQLVDLSTPKSRLMLAFIFLPYILMLTAFTGGMHIAIDTTAGEKERRSLEPLLLNPVPRWQIMTGKMLATVTFAFASLTLTLIAFRVALPQMPLGTLGADLTLGTDVMLKTLALVAPVALLGAAMLTMLASFAKSFREAQSYMGLVILIPMIPSMMFMVNPVKPEASMMWIPLFSQNILIGEAVRGEVIPSLWIAMSAGGTLAIGLVLAVIAATLYNRPKLIFSGS